MDPHRLGELRSIEYHRAIAARLDVAVVARARRRLGGDDGRSHLTHPVLVEQWRTLLALPVAELAARLVEDNERMTRLRSSSPFAGELRPADRWRIWREVRERSE